MQWQELLTLPQHMSSPPVFIGVRVTRSLALYVCFVDHYLSFCNFSFGHCVVCSSSIYVSDYPFGIFKLVLNKKVRKTNNDPQKTTQRANKMSNTNPTNNQEWNHVFREGSYSTNGIRLIKDLTTGVIIRKGDNPYLLLSVCYLRTWRQVLLLGKATILISSWVCIV
jgi:hypothetical protein